MKDSEKVEFGKFCRHVLAFALTITVAIVVLCFSYLKYLEQSSVYHTQMPNKIAVSAVGNSHMEMSFTFPGSQFYDGSEGGADTFNFGMSSQSYFYDYALIHHYVKNLEDGGTIFIDGSYEKILSNEVKPTLFEKNFRYYPLLSVAEMHFYEPIDAYKGYFQLLYKVHSWVNHIFNVQETSEEDECKQLSIDVEKNVAENMSHLEDIIHLCQEKSMRVILVTTPYQKAYVQSIPEEGMEYFNKAVDYLKKTYGIEYWDYGVEHDYEESEFVDKHHLNAQGAHRFTMEMLERVNTEQ